MNHRGSTRLATLLVVALMGAALGAIDAPRHPTNVYVGIVYNSLDKISGAEETFNSDFYISMYWYDPNVDLTNGTTFDENTMWFPASEFVNVRSFVSDLSSPPQFSYDVVDNASFYVTAPETDDLPFMDQPWVQYNQRIVGAFSATFDLRQFPFDKQTALVVLESSYYSEYYLKFVPVGGEKRFELNVLPDGFTVPEFEIISDAKLSMKRRYFVPSDEYYSSFQIGIALRRLPQYYLMKICSGCMLLVLMSISIFVLDVEEADRLMGTITVFLALISFVFVAAADLPKVAYLTKIDQFLFLSFILVTVMAIAHMVLYVVNIRQQEKLKADEEQARVAESSERAADVEMHVVDGERTPSGHTPQPSTWARPSRVADAKAAPPGPKKRLPCLQRWKKGIIGLRLVRKLDVSCMVVFSLVYLISCAIILRNSDG